MDVLYRRELLAALVAASVTASIWLSVSGTDERILPVPETPVTADENTTESETQTGTEPLEADDSPQSQPPSENETPETTENETPQEATDPEVNETNETNETEPEPEPEAENESGIGSETGNETGGNSSEIEIREPTDE